MNQFEVIVRPYDFTERNGYRKSIGSRPADRLTLAMLDSIHQHRLLSDAHVMTYEDHVKINSSLNSIVYLGPRTFNQDSTDSIAAIRQDYQYGKLLDIVESMPVFAKIYAPKDHGDSISYQEGYKRAAEFWNLRNETMAIHMAQFIQEFKGKRIVVLNGFFHRYFLRRLLEPRQAELGFVVKEYYTY